MLICMTMSSETNATTSDTLTRPSGVIMDTGTHDVLGCVCPLCDCAEAHLVRRESDGTLVQCNDCAFLYVSARPTDDDLTLLYDDEYFASEDLSTCLEFRRPVFRQCLTVLDELCADRGRLLDIGCGTGEFLEDARKCGWQAEGLESSRSAAEYARDKKNLPVHHATLQTAPFPLQSFDIVTLLDVLEHLRRPREEMLRVNGLLKKEGIVVVRLPNTNFHLFKCRICHVLRVHDYGLQMKYHLNHFTPATIKKLLRSTGFEPLRVDVGASETIAHAPWLNPQAKRLYVSMASVVKAVTGLHFGNILVAYGRKTS